uniref:Uncharacterized protein n=1 Tax=Anguilla anguilla TaxID=7936 RepID=A0A0E9RAU2_ANGAN
MIVFYSTSLRKLSSLYCPLEAAIRSNIRGVNRVG